MNTSDSPTSLIRAGFFIGIGIAVAYMTLWVVLMLGMYFFQSAGSIYQWLTDIFPRMPWAGPALTAILLLALIGLLIYFSPALYYRFFVMRKNRY